MSNARSISKLASLASHLSNLIGLSNSKASIDAKVSEGLIPVGIAWDWTLPDLPEGGWIWADGVTLLSNTPHQTLRNKYIAAGFPHGQDGNGNPKIPDIRGRVVAGKDNMGGSSAGRLVGFEEGTSGLDGNILGAAGGFDRHRLSLGEMPEHRHTPIHPDNVPFALNIGSAGTRRLPFTTDGAAADIFTDFAGDNAAHPNVQPTIVLNKIIKT